MYAVSYHYMKYIIVDYGVKQWYNHMKTLYLQKKNRTYVNGHKEQYSVNEQSNSKLSRCAA